MEEATWLAAWAAVASAIVGFGALVISIGGRRRSRRAEAEASTARADVAAAQREISQRLAALDEMSNRLDRLTTTQERALAARQAEAEASRGGHLSARLNGANRVIATNVGADPLTILAIDVPESARVQGGPDPTDVELGPGEHFGVMVGISMDVPLPLPVILRWRDLRGEHERKQHLTL
jgi:hypothetical protein